MATTQIIRTGCPAHNCGGRCLLRAHVQDGRIVRLETDDRPEDAIASPQLRACTRGRAYLRRQYHPDRLTRPLLRTGARGEGRFQPIAWDEALDRMAEQMRRVRDRYGHGALFVPYGTGGYTQTTGSQTARRLLNCFGGHLGHYNSYSWGATNIVTPATVGTVQCGNERQDWLNAKLILLWGWNPAEARDGTNSDWFILQARRRGARVVCIDPRHTPSAASLADEWIPIRPGTDTALMTAMAFVILSEGLHDRDFIARCCSGFDAAQMPAEAAGAESYREYVQGERDGVPKTPEWAAEITGVPHDRIVRLARDYATRGPAVLYQGYAMQRRAFGEQVVRAGMALAAITGNVGISGGWASGLSSQPTAGPNWSRFPEGVNPHGLRIPCFLWTEAVVRGREMGREHGVLGLEERGMQRLDSDIKLIWSVASNVLAGQHGDLNRTAQILSDESLLEYIVVQDNFLTPTARFADLVLPACTQFETWGLADGWKYGQEVILLPQLVEPLGESKSDYRICADLARKLGIGEAYTEGRDERGWTEWILDSYRADWFPGIPTLDEMVDRNLGAYTAPVTEPIVGLADFRRDPVAHPLATPSGRIELFSLEMHRFGQPEQVPAVPKYLQEWESPFGPEAEKHPLQCIANHTLARVHSTHENNDWLRAAHPHRLQIHPLDAEARGLTDGQEVRVFNERGATVVPCSITRRILPGVVNLPQGTWWTPDEDGVDRRGSINVLTSLRWTPYAFGAALQTVMVQVVAEEPGTGKAMTRRLAFRFDAAACSGCKACQIACQDRHGLPATLPWRRISEVSGGTWRQEGATWRNDVFAYHLSISCNHCERPICREGCPAAAISQRADGLVRIDPQRCLGCGYCSWICPYSSPRYDEAAGVMGKCTFCDEDLDAGLEPACVAACPVRALDAGDADELRAKYGDPVGGVAIPPLPDPALTEPSLLLAPHALAERSHEPDTELKPKPPRGLREWSLVVFTLLSQAGAGLVLYKAWLRLPDYKLTPAERHEGTALLTAAVLLIVAMAFSGLHLGRPRRAFGALTNLRSSWLSREILLALLLLGVTLTAWRTASEIAFWSATVAAVAYVAGMAQVYRQRTVPSWNRRGMLSDFLSTSVMLGLASSAFIGLILDGSPAKSWPTVGFVLAMLLLVGILVRERKRHYEDYERTGV